VTFIIKRFFWIQNANYDKIIIQFSQLSVIFFKQNLVILPQNISITPNGPKCKHVSFCSMFYNLSEYCSLDIALWDKQGLLVIQKLPSTGKSFTYFRQKSAVFTPK
jgi:hypothetical protein